MKEPKPKPKPAPKPAALPDEPAPLEERRRPRILYTDFGGINLNAVAAYIVHPISGRVQVTVNGTWLDLIPEDSYRFLKMMGDSRHALLTDVVGNKPH